MRTSIVDYCAIIGADPLLVQGAGGNVSWKDGNTLWIKASGTRLSDAAHKDIFVPVDLDSLHSSIASGDYAALPRLRDESAMRPSIETPLHALMPHPVVVHLHAIEVLAHLVRRNYKADIARRLGNSLRWVSASYQRPGAALVKAVGAALAEVGETEVVLLQNHGVVIGGSTVSEVDGLLRSLVSALATPPRLPITVRLPEIPLTVGDLDPYLPVPDPAVHQLAIDAVLFDRLSNDWALYPDHVVFLGARPACYVSVDELRTKHFHHNAWPPLVFVREVGVFSKPQFGAFKQAQLRCYYDVLSRQPEGCAVNSLNSKQIAELLDWEAEHYRIQSQS